MKQNRCVHCNWFPQPNALNLVSAEHSGQTYKGICFVKGKRSCSFFSAIVCGIVMVTENFDNIYHMAQKSLVSLFPI